MILLTIWLLFIHWVADFILQSHEIATSKWKCLPSLLWHALVYTSILYVGSAFTSWPPYTWDMHLQHAMIFSVINGTSHLIIDFCSSKVTHYLFDKQDWHNGFVVVGFDQLIHTSIIITSAAYIL